MRKAEPIAAAFRVSLTPTVLVRVSDGAIFSVNPAGERLLGYSFAQLRERTPSELGLWPSTLEHARVWAQVGEDGSARAVALNLRRADGIELALTMDCEALHWRGETLLLCFLQLSESEDAAQKPAKSLMPSLHEALIDACRDGMFVILSGTLRFANEALADLLQMPLEKLIGSKYLDFVHPDDREPQLRRVSEMQQAQWQGEQRYRIRLHRADGQYRHFEVVAAAMPLDDGIAAMGVARDITEELEQHQALILAERRYRDLFDSSPIGLFKTHADGRILEANQALLELIGFDGMDELQASGWNMQDVYLDLQLRDWMMETVVEIGLLRDVEMEIRTRNGPRWISCCVRRVEGEGDRAMFAGSVQDIGPRRAAELALKQAEARYRALVDHVQVGVFLALDGRFVQINAALASILSRAEVDLVGQKISDLAAGDSRGEIERRYWKKLAGEPVESDFEVEFRRADGRQVWVQERLSAVEIQGQVYLSGTWREVTREREVERRLRFNASHDSLTGLPNRLDFQQRLNELILESRAAGRFDYALLFLDLDGFKLINDSQGHAAGDRLLISLAARLTDAVAGEALIARYGGDEFTVLPFGPCDRARAVGLAQRLLRVFEQPMNAGEEQVFSSASVGIVLGLASYRDAADVLRDADTAMYRAKASGKATWRVFDDRMRSEAKRRYEVEREIRQGLDSGEFEVHFQPIVDLSSQAPVGCEALVRWRHPERGLLFPDEFLGIAEESGLIVRLDAWVMDQACREAREWPALGWSSGSLSVSINVNDRQANSAHFVSEVAGVLQRYGLPGEVVRLEITETAFREGRQRASDLLNALKALGVALAVDDFGTGYSSLESFSSAPFDTLKIDRSLVQDLPTNSKHRAIVRTILAFGRELGLSTVAEGVETIEQQQALQEFGCRFVQGFLYARALSSADWRRYLAQSMSAQAASQGTA